ncbi:MAG TPA: HAD family hydrolase, partial [Candidatus Binataceae bacterium]|nr:HAD family hydrolase [Candidatus Binataceae bacterium]
MPGAAVSGNPAAQLWLFDFDNTLAALEKEVDWAASRQDLESFLRSEGVDEGVFREFPTRNLTLYDALLRRSAMSRRDSASLMRQASVIIEAHELRGIKSASPMPGAIKMLQALHRAGKRIAIVTSNSAVTASRWLTLHTLNAEVGAIVGRDSLLPLKPAPEMVLHAIALSRATVRETVMVGDSQADLNAARHAQIGFFGVAGTAETKSQLVAAGAREVFQSLRELGCALNLP